MVTEARCVKAGIPIEGRRPEMGVRASIGAEKCRNGHGAKGSRKVE